MANLKLLKTSGGRLVQMYLSMDCRKKGAHLPRSRSDGLPGYAVQEAIRLMWAQSNFRQAYDGYDLLGSPSLATSLVW